MTVGDNSSISEMPAISSSSYSSATTSIPLVAMAGMGSQHLVPHAVPFQINWHEQLDGVVAHKLMQQSQQKQPKQQKQQQQEQQAMSDRRIVQVFIIDPDTDVPLDHAILYRGEQHMTESTDQELFFELNIKEILATHNEKRVTFKRKGKERKEALEPVRIRDLKMTVVTIASF